MRGGAWSDIYSLSVEGRRFRISVFYNNEAANLKTFRARSLQILSSVEPRGPKHPPGGE